MVKTIITVLVLLCSLASEAQAHGLKLSEGKTILYDRIDNIMVKIELTPNDIQFNQENQMEVSVIDISEGGIFDKNIQLTVNHLDMENNSSIFSGEYPKGIFKQPIVFQTGGAHELELSLPDKNTVFNFQIELKDNRSFAYATALTTIVFFSIFACLTGYILRYRRDR